MKGVGSSTGVSILHRVALLVFAAAFTGCGGGGEDTPHEREPCTSGAECPLYCGVPYGTPVGTSGLVGECYDKIPKEIGCLALLEDGTVVIEVCY